MFSSLPEQRTGILRIANPVSGSFFYAWALGIIWFDAAKSGTVDPTVFMTFSLVVPLSFYMPPKVYVAIDINGLKGVNDNQGHEAGDRMILGAAQCIEACFSDRGKTYRLGGDEFAALIHIDQGALDKALARFEASMAAWSESNHIDLGASYGCASRAEYPKEDVEALAKIADERMYAAKEQYYLKTGKQRRT